MNKVTLGCKDICYSFTACQRKWHVSGQTFFISTSNQETGCLIDLAGNLDACFVSSRCYQAKLCSQISLSQVIGTWKRNIDNTSKKAQANLTHFQNWHDMPSQLYGELKSLIGKSSNSRCLLFLLLSIVFESCRSGSPNQASDA